MQPTAAYKVRQLQHLAGVGEAILSDTSRVQPSSQALHEHQAFLRGIEQFNTGRFFDAHETWEEIWLRSPEPDKTFLQGIIQIAAAFHHYSRGNVRGTRNLLEAGLGRLGRFPETHRGIAVGTLRSEARACFEVLVLGGGERPGELAVPTIVLVEIGSP